MRHARATILPAALAALLGIVSPGCAPFISWTVAQFAPPQKVKALYKPPAGKSILVFVDDPRLIIDHEPVKSKLTALLNERLERNEVTGKTIPYTDLVNLMASTPGFNLLSISEVGMKLQADVVLYVKVDKFSVMNEEINPLWQGTFEATVRMVESRTGDCLWPGAPEAGHTLPTLKTAPTEGKSATQAMKLANELAERMADQIAKLLYDHKVDVSGGRSEKSAPIDLD